MLAEGNLLRIVEAGGEMWPQLVHPISMVNQTGAVGGTEILNHQFDALDQNSGMK